MSDETQSQEDPRWREWMAAAQGGDQAAYARLLEDLVPFVRRVVRGRVSDTSAADDVMQEVLLSIHTARHTYRPERPLGPWVRTIARNAAIDWGRRQTRDLKRHVDVENVEPKATGPSPDEFERGLSPELSRALALLPDAQREAVILLKLEGLSVEEAANRVGVSSGALKLRAHRGYRGLRDALGNERW